MNAHEDVLRKLSIQDDAYVAGLLADDGTNLAESMLEGKTHCLVQLGALAAIDAPLPSYMEVVEQSRRHGVSDDEIVGVLIAVLPATGAARVVSAAPKLALVLGYDVDEALERRS